jgi:hypothetical protein
MIVGLSESDDDLISYITIGDSHKQERIVISDDDISKYQITNKNSHACSKWRVHIGQIGHLV